MKIPSFKWIILIVVLFTICYLNNRYEIFAVNISKGQRNEKVEGSFRVMTYNVNTSMATEDIENVRDALIKEIEKQQPDILCLQELCPPIFKEIQNSLDSLFGYTDSMAIKKELLRYCLYSRKPIRNFKQYKCFTKIDTTGLDQQLQNEIKLIQKQMSVYSAEIEVDLGRWITFFSVHLRSSAYSTSRRSMDEGSSWFEGIPFYLNNFKIGEKIRNYEAENLRMQLDSLESKGTPIIIAGDFNDWSGSKCMNTIRTNYFKDAWWEGGNGLGITYNGWNLLLRLDHILYSNQFQLVNIIVEKSDFSDHYPLVADFIIK